MFVKYDCGCVGIPFKIGIFRDNNEAIIIKACDREINDGEYSFFIRDMAKKTCEPIAEFEQKILIGKINSLITKGYILTEIRHLLKEN